MDAISGYQLLGCVSENRPISIWKARDLERNRDVALKQAELSNTRIITLMRAKVRVLSGISHPSIVEVFDLVEDGTHAWLVEEWLDGISVADLVAAHGPLSGRQSMAIVSAFLPGLIHAHEQAIVHGAVGPSTVFVDAKGNAKLVDFGVTTPGRQRTLEADLHDVATLLDPELLSGLGPVRDARHFQLALEEAATRTYGGEWRAAADVRAIGELVERAQPPAPIATAAETLAPIPPGAAKPPMGSGSSVQVRSTGRGAKSAHDKAEGDDVVQYMQTRALPRGSGEGRAGRFIPLIAAAVVVAAIAVLVVTHQEKGGDTRPGGLAFNGDYAISVMLRTAGVGPDAGKPAGSVLSDTWRVSTTCPSSHACVAIVTPATGAPFTLNLTTADWMGARPMAAGIACAKGAQGGPGAGLYSIDLKAVQGGHASPKMTGTISGAFAGCGSAGTEQGDLTVQRTGDQ